MKLPDGYELEASVYMRYSGFASYSGYIRDFTFTGDFKIHEDGNCFFAIKYSHDSEKYEKVTTKQESRTWYGKKLYTESTDMVPTPCVVTKISWVSDGKFRLVYVGSCSNKEII